MRGGASGRRALRDMGREGEEGGDESEGWIGGGDDASDAHTEEEGWGHAPLTALPWDRQESRERGIRVDARDGGSDGRKAPSATADEAGTRGLLGHSVKHGGIGIPDPRLSAERAYNTPKEASRELVDSLL